MNIIVLLSIIILSVFIFLFFIAIASPKKREPYENGLVPEFEEICGGRINFLNYTWPLLRHSIYKEFVVVKSLFGAYMLPRESLSQEGADGLFSEGIRYKSPKYIGFEFRIWTLNKSKVMEILKSKA